MPGEHILILSSMPESDLELGQGVLRSAGFKVTALTDLKEGESILREAPPDLIILAKDLPGEELAKTTENLRRRYPLTPILLMPGVHSNNLMATIFQAGISGYIPPPVRSTELLQSIEAALALRTHWLEQVRLAVKRDTKSLQKRVDSLETIARIGRKVTSILDLDSVLSAIVDAAVELTQAEEGSLLLLDENNTELSIRASHNFQQEFARSFRLTVQDSLAGQVVRTGKPLLLDEEQPQKIKTSYLVHTLIYMPVMLQDNVIGVLEVDNRQSGKKFSDVHLNVLAALAEYAAIALENARLFAHSERERQKLETILSQIEDGVIVAGFDGRLILINHKALEVFGIQEANPCGKRVRELIHNQDLLDALQADTLAAPVRIEVNLDNGRVMNAQISPIQEVGLVVVMQDITHLKELDRIKTDFVNTVSHDLRSPLTAILGYVELIDRVGPVNPQQSEFIHRVQLSVHSITALINDLLDLGRIEAGFDARNEFIPFAVILHYAIDGLKNRAAEKNQQLIVDVSDNLPKVLGNPIRLRQMVNNLLSNAIQFTPPGGIVGVSARAEAGQIILQISDNGPGIPPQDQPFIFDKFYRASNIDYNIPGSGLGLAIVKSIVDHHLGRIWVDSTPRQGTIFTVVLPIEDSDL